MRASAQNNWNLGLWQTRKSLLLAARLWQIRSCFRLLIQPDDKRSVGWSWVNMAEHTRNSRSSPEGGLRDISSEKSSVYFDVLFPPGNCNPNRTTANNKSKLQNPLYMKWCFAVIVKNTFSISADPLRCICFECSQPETPEYCMRCSSTSIPTKIQYSYFEVDPNLKRKVCKCTNCPYEWQGSDSAQNDHIIFRLSMSFSSDSSHFQILPISANVKKTWVVNSKV